jgi:hypothetical protein
MRLHMPQHGSAFASVARAVADTDALLGAIDLVRVERGEVVRDVTVACVDGDHAEAVVRAVRGLEGVRVDSVSDRTFLMHKGGKIEITPKLPIKTRDDLSMAYTPGVGRVSMAIHDDPAKAWALTIKSNTVAIISDGTAVLGLGDIGREAAMPVMEGKAMLFKEFGGVDAFPLCLDTKNVDQIVAFVKAAAPDSAGSTSRTSPRPGALRSNAGCAQSSTSRSSTTISTAPRSSCSPAEGIGLRAASVPSPSRVLESASYGSAYVTQVRAAAGRGAPAGCAMRFRALRRPCGGGSRSCGG